MEKFVHVEILSTQKWTPGRRKSPVCWDYSSSQGQVEEKTVDDERLLGS